MHSNSNLEIERKFLIKYPNFGNFIFNKKVNISQSYLIRENPEIERRIRLWKEDDNIQYYYTEKKFLTSSVREEVEKEITESEYNSLKSQIDDTIVTVEKTRYTLNYSNLTFEIDVYPFSNDYAIMEVELEDESQKYTIPKGIELIKEVTGIKEYGNVPLCTAKEFPTKLDFFYQ